MPKKTKYASIDAGAFSMKGKSAESDFSFYSAAVRLLDISTLAFSPVANGESFDISILNAKGLEEHNVRDITGRWIVGKAAHDFPGTEEYTRDIQRFRERLYRVLMSAALMNAFPDTFHSLGKLASNGGAPSQAGRALVKVVVSVPPGYYGNERLLSHAAKGHYDFIDNARKRFYSFEVRSAMVVPESFGILASKMFVVDKSTGLVTKRTLRKIAKGTTAVFDGGRRTFDFTAWREGLLLDEMRDSLDTGIGKVARDIARDVIATYMDDFQERPTALEVIHAIVKRNMSRGRQSEILLGSRDGGRLDITDIADQHMNRFAQTVRQGYSNTLRGGQGIDVILMGGGACLALQPYLDNIRHQGIQWAGSNMKDMYMANARGAYLHLLYKNQEGANGRY